MSWLGQNVDLDWNATLILAGTGAMTGVEYIPYHTSQAVVHKIYRDTERPSHLLLPNIPKGMIALTPVR